MLFFGILSLFVFWQRSDAIQLAPGVTKLSYYDKYINPVSNITRAKANFSCFDIRVGKIIDIQNHSADERSYIMKVDFGSIPQRTIVDSIRPYIPVKKLLNELCLFMLNWLPYSSDGVASEGLIMVACDGRIMEILHPPEGSIPGDIAYVPGYEYDPVPVLSQQNFLDAFYDLHTDGRKRVCYSHTPLNVSGKGYAIVYDIFEPCQIR